MLVARTDKKQFFRFLRLSIFLIGFFVLLNQSTIISRAAINPEINYQAKLKDASGNPVADGQYNVVFRLYTSAESATTTNIWEEELVSANRINITDGLFTYLLGSTTPLTGIDFNQTLYLGVEIGGSGVSPVWDGEMSPRKRIGSVPSAFTSDKLDNLDSEQFLRSDISDLMQATSTQALLTIRQNGTGDIFSIKDATNDVLNIADGGDITFGNNGMFFDFSNNRLGIGTTSPLAKLDIYGNAMLSGADRYINFGFATSSAGYGFRDNGGVIQFKNANGDWMNISTGTADSVDLWVNGEDKTTGIAPISVAIGDLNNDGYNDLAVANPGSNTVSFFINNQDGTFAGKVDKTTGVFPFSVAIGDLNNDGYNDLAVANYGSHTVSIFINNQDGTFADKVDKTTGFGPTSVAVGDLNNDGYNDLAVVNSNSNTVSIFINNQNGTFADKVDRITGVTPFSIAIGDLDNDGYNDLAIANQSNTVSIFINNQDGTFADKVDKTTGTIPYFVAVGDLNNDGYNDLAVVNYGSNTVSVFINNQNGTFADKVDKTTGTSPNSVAVGDLNNDGYNDLVVANVNSNSVSVFINNQNGTFADKVDKTTGADPASVAIGDLDNDGYADLAVTNGGSTVSIIFNNLSSYQLDQGIVEIPKVNSRLTVMATPLAGASSRDALILVQSDRPGLTSFLGSANGTYLGLNADSSFRGNFIDIQSNGASKLTLDYRGYLGIGTTSPQYSLDVNGLFRIAGTGTSTIEDNLHVKGQLKVGNNSVYITETGIYRDSGLLEIGGDGLALMGRSSAPTGSAGQMYYNTSENKMFFHNGTSWNELGGGASYWAATGTDDIYNTNAGQVKVGEAGLKFAGSDQAPINPTEGEFYYNKTSKKISYYTGTEWQELENGEKYGFGLQRNDYETGVSPMSVAVGDLDNDGYNDLAIANYSTNSVSVLINNQDGTFAAKADYAVGTAPVSVAIGDFDKDGYNDLAVANTGSDNVSILINDQDGTFAAKVDYAAGTAPGTVAIGDLNNDGYADLATANTGSDNVSILINDQDGTFAVKVDYAAGTLPISVAIGDVDNDGYKDLVAANGMSDSVSVLINDQDGTFATKIDYVVGSMPYSVAIGDLNNDGYNDIATANYNSNNVSVLINDQDGTFAAKVDYAAGTNPSSVAIGDLNNDGYNDIATANYGAYNVSIIINNQDGTFASKVDYATSFEPWSVAIGDLNNDGYNDLAVTNSKDTINSVSVFINNSQADIFSVKNDYTTNSQPTFAAIGDLNNDGYDDLVLTSTPSNNISVFMNNQDGTFAAKVDYVSSMSAFSVAIGDLNNDGYNDLAVVYAGVTGYVSVFTNNQDGTFTQDNDYLTGSRPYRVVIGDLNNDGYNDLATANYNSNSVSVLINDQAGSFAAKVDYAVGTNPYFIVIGDLNNDGYNDLATANYNSNNVSVLINNKDGLFATKADYAVGSKPQVIAIGDLDNDGYNDLATANVDSNNVSVLINDQDGAFVSKVDYTTGGLRPTYIAIGDLNNDGFNDLAATNMGGTISVMINSKTGVFTDNINYAFGSWPYSLAISDLNNDGFNDLVAVGYVSNIVSVFLNNYSSYQLKQGIVEIPKVNSRLTVMATPLTGSSSREALILVQSDRPGLTGFLGSADGTYLGLNADNSFRGNFLDIQTNGASKLTLDYRGSLGLGTTSPLAKLDVYGNMMLSGTNRYLNFGSATSSLGYGLRDNSGTLEFKNSGGSWTAFSSLGGGGGGSGTLNYGLSGSLAYYPANGATATGTTDLLWNESTNVLTIGSAGSSFSFPAARSGSANYVLKTDASGNVTWQADANTTYSASNGLTLSVSNLTLGGNLLQATTITQGANNMVFNLNSTGNFDIQDNGTSAFYVKNDGLVGIGTDNPQAKLNIRDSSGTQLRISYNDSVYADFSQDSNGVLGITPTGTYGTTKFNMSSTLAYSPTLTGADMYSPIASDAIFASNNNASGDFVSILMKAGGTGVNLSTGRISLIKSDTFLSDMSFSLRNSTNMSEVLRLKHDGKIGIGTTTPGRKLDVVDSTASQLRLSHTAGSVYTDFQTTSAGELNIAPSGINVGINTANPSYALDVTGVVQASGGFRTNSEIITDFTGTGLSLTGGALGAVVGNGLSVISNTIGLGGTLGANTTVAQGAYGMIFDLTDSGDFDIRDNGASAFFVRDNGNIGINTNNPGVKLDARASDTSAIPTGNLTAPTASDIASLFNTSDSAVYSGLYLRTRTTGQSVWLVGNEYKASGQGDLFFRARNGSASSEVMRMTYDGKVNIGTTQTTYVFSVDHNRDGLNYAYVNNSNAWTNGSADYAEFMWTEDTSISAGDAVCADTATSSTAIIKCDANSLNSIIGIISESPAVLGNAPAEEQRENNPNYKMVAMLGQVSVKASNENGNIRSGDKLTISATLSGYVMKADDGDSLAAMALGDMNEAIGKVNAYIYLQDRKLSVLEVDGRIESKTENYDKAFAIDSDGNIQFGPNADIDQASSTPAVAIVEITTATTTTKTAFIINQEGSGDVADFQIDDVSIMNIDNSGKVTVVGEILVDGRIMACSGGSCGAILDAAVDETMGDIGVEGKVVAGAFEGYCETGYIWVTGSAKYGTMPGFCVQEDKMASSSLPWTNISMGESQVACQAEGDGYHLITENEWLTIAENIMKVADNDVVPGEVGMQLATSTSGTTTAYKLVSGNTIYNFVDDIGEWTDELVTKSGVPTLASTTEDWQEYYEVNDYKGLDVVPAYYLDSTNGIGMIRVSTSGSSLKGFIRGYNGIYSLDLRQSPTTVSPIIGFRCAK